MYVNHYPSIAYQYFSDTQKVQVTTNWFRKPPRNMQVKTPLVLFLLAISVKLFRDVFRLNMKEILEVAWVKESQSKDVTVCMTKNVMHLNV